MSNGALKSVIIMDMYSRILQFLYENRLDGDFHEIEHLFSASFNYDKLSRTLRELKYAGQIDYQRR